MNDRVSRVLLVWIIVAALIGGLGCVTHNITQAPTTGRVELKPGAFNQFSPQQDIQIGQQAKQQVLQTMPVLPESSPVARYVSQLGQQIAAHAPEPNKWPFEFHVVNQKEINAFALPGGPIFLNLGTIQAADDEGELAGVMAHETSHVVLRHSTEQASKAQIIQGPLSILDAILGGGGSIAQLSRIGLSFGAQSLFLKYSRTAESEADELGSQIMYDTGYDPYDMAEFFTKLEKQGGPGAPQFLSDHPSPGNRVAAVRAIVSKYPPRQYRHDSPEFQRIKAQVATMKPYTAQQIAQMQQQRQQATIGAVSSQAVMPSGSFNTLDHQAFQIAYPSNWQVFGSQNSSVTIAPQAGVSQNAIAYGVIVSGFRPQQGEDLQTATQQLIQTIEQGNAAMRVGGNAQQISVSGLPAFSVPLVGPSPIQTSQGTLAERDQLVTVQRPDGLVLFLVFIAPERDFQQLAPVYQQMLQSLRMKSS